MRVYTDEELRRFLRGVDAALEGPEKVLLIGMGAACVHYRAEAGTHDLDTWTTIGAALRAAVEDARQATGLLVPFEHASVADAPYEFETRLVATLPGLQRLKVWVPERHDLALMKAIGRGVEKDLDGIVAIHKRAPLSLEVLATRYVSEMDHVIGDPTRNRGRFLNMLGRLYPPRTVNEVQRRLGPPGLFRRPGREGGPER